MCSFLFFSLGDGGGGCFLVLVTKDYNILPWEGLGMAYEAAQIWAIPQMNGFPGALSSVTIRDSKDVNLKTPEGT